MKLFIDFETRSRADIRACGAWRYAEDPSTEVLCLSLRAGDKKWLYVPIKWRLEFGKPESIHQDQVEDLIQQADTIHAHNMEFETAIWHWCLYNRGPFSPLPREKLRCTAAAVAVCTLPRKLEKAAQLVEAAEQKDVEGHRLMLKWCKPRRPTKNNPARWHSDPEEFVRLCQYCEQDTLTEMAVDERIPPMTTSETMVWRMDQKINGRGMPIDVASAKLWVEHNEEFTDRWTEEFRNLTGGMVDTARQRDALLEVLKLNGEPMEDMRKETVEAMLKRKDLDPKVRRILNLRNKLAKSSVDKYKGLLNRVSGDCRLRSCYMYHGASTGRWTGKGFQPQNLYRGTIKEVDEVYATLHKPNGHHIVDTLWGWSEAAASCLRGIIRAEPGRRFLCADLSGIEGRTLAWLAGEKKVLDIWATRDAYAWGASLIYGVPEAEVTKTMRADGKVNDLACGYQGGEKAIASWADKFGLEMTKEDRLHRRDIWRENHPMTVKLWHNLEDAVLKAVACPGKTVECGRLLFGVRGSWLICRLPSGRLIYYFQPSIKAKETPWGAMKDAVHYWGVDSVTNQWTETHLYGGKITENAVQAIARDILVAGMLRLEAANYPIVLHTHDENCCELPEGQGSLQEMIQLMTISPTWAPDLPLAADGWEGERYRKD